MTTAVTPTAPPPGAAKVHKVKKQSEAATARQAAQVKAMREPREGELVTSDEDVRAAFKRMAAADRLYVDCETSGLDRRQPLAIGLSLSDGGKDDWACYIPWGHQDYGTLEEPQASLDLVKELWQDLVLNTSPEKWRFFNKPFDRGMLGATLGTAPDWHPEAYDVHHLAFLVNENGSHRLKDLAVRYVDPEANAEQLALAPFLTDMKNTGHLRVPPRVEAPYAAEDARLTAKLDQLLHPKAAQDELLGVLKLETQLMPVLMDIEDTGMLVDKQYMATKEAETVLQLEQLRARFQELTGWLGSTSSVDQLRELLYNDWNLRVGRVTMKGEASTDKWAIERLVHENPDKREALSILQEISTLETLLNMFYAPIQMQIDDQNVVHTRYNSMVRTGRTSSSSPNLQQLPARQGPEVRKGFKVRDGKAWLLIDYSQIELRVLAHYCQDVQMRAAYDRGEDLHTATAALMGVPRKLAKTLNFAQVYGAGVAQLARTADCTDDRARELKSMYSRTYPGVSRFSREAMYRAESRGWVKTIAGRRRHFDDKHYRAANAIIQGSAADIAKLGMIQVHRHLEEKYNGSAKLVGFVHDEFIIEVDKGLERQIYDEVRPLMCSTFPLTVPVEVTPSLSHTSWGDEEEHEEWNEPPVAG